MNVTTGTMTGTTAVLLLACLPGCSEVAYQARVISRLSNVELWDLYLEESDFSGLSLIEVELMARNDIFKIDKDDALQGYAGQRVLSLVEPDRFPREDPVPDGTCATFESRGAAQQAFLSAGAPLEDRKGLDPDGDGLACGWKACLTYARDEGQRYQAAYRRWERGPRYRKLSSLEKALYYGGTAIIYRKPPDKVPIHFSSPERRPKPEGC